MVSTIVVNVDAVALGLIDLLYLGLEEEAAFGSFAENLTVALGATAAALTFDLDPERNRTINGVFGVDPGRMKQYEDYYHFINVHEIQSAPRFSPGSVLSTGETCTDRVLLSSEYYNDFLRPQGFYHVCGAIVRLGSKLTSILSVYPARHSDSVSDQGMSLMEVLIPHLQRVRNLSMQIGITGPGIQALNHSPTGVIVTSADAKILLMNAAAERFIARSDGLSSSGGFFRATQPQDATKLRQSIRSVCAGVEEPSMGRITGVPITLTLGRRLGARPYQVAVERFVNKPSGMAARTAILYIIDPDEAPDIPQKTLAVVYGLTAAEARLSNLLLQGQDLTEACASLAIRRNTGRAHLRSIFDKLGVNSQSQMIALIARGRG